MTRQPTGIGKGGSRPGSGRPATGNKFLHFNAVINHQRAASYREYLEVREGRPVTDKEVVEFARRAYFQALESLDHIVGWETDKMDLIF